jgi:acyl-CoA reductase-like NAD-dependent aldehyde dehydrogenase
VASRIPQTRTGRDRRRPHPQRLSGLPRAPHDHEHTAIHNPATGQLITTLPADDAASVAAKAAAARAAQPAWAATTMAERKACIERFRAGVVRDLESLAVTMTRETGKPIKMSRNELNGLLGRIDFFLKEIELSVATETVFDDGGMHEQIQHPPLGVVANISAWNYPWFVGCNVIVPALLTGNAVLYKPSEYATMTGQEITRLLHEAGVPREVMVCLVGAGEVGAALLEQPVDGVFFTGSVATGSASRRPWATNSSSCSSSSAARTRPTSARTPTPRPRPSRWPTARCTTPARAAARSSASTCTRRSTTPSSPPLSTPSRPSVPVTRWERTPTSARSRVRRSWRCSTHRWPTLWPRARTAGRRQTRQRPVRPGAGNWYEPTVLANVNHSMELMREESFGPIIGIQKVSGDAEAVKLMNDTRYGLTAGVYTPDQERAQRLLAQVNAGSVYWNCCDRVSPRLPWSGHG